MIGVRGVTKSYGRIRVLKEISLEVGTGTIAILGASGSGKTTLLRLIAGLERPEQGEIYLDGRLVSQPHWILPPHQRGIGFVFQSSALWPHMTVAQNIAFGLDGLSKGERQQRLNQILETMALSRLSHRYPHQLSGGEARRVALARALAPRPPYLLFDEPLTNLDPTIKLELLKYVHEHLEMTEACSIYVTHDVTEALQITDCILVLRDGQLDAYD